MSVAEGVNGVGDAPILVVDGDGVTIQRLSSLGRVKSTVVESVPDKICMLNF